MDLFQAIATAHIYAVKHAPEGRYPQTFVIALNHLGYHIASTTPHKDKKA